MKWYNLIGLFGLVMSYYGTYMIGRTQWEKWQNESGIFIRFDKGMIAPQGMTPFIDVRHNGHKTRIYRTGQVYEEVVSSIPGQDTEFHRMNYWVQF